MLRGGREEESDSDTASFYSVDIESDTFSSKLTKFDSFKSLDSVHYKSDSLNSLEDCKLSPRSFRLDLDQSCQPRRVFFESRNTEKFSTPKKNITNVVIMSSGATPKTDAKDPEKKKKGIRISFKRKKSSKKLTANEEGVGTSSDNCSSNMISPGVISQGTMKKNVSAPSIEEKDHLDIKTGKYSQVSGRVLSERKFGPLVISMKEGKPGNFSLIKHKQKENIPIAKNTKFTQIESSQRDEDRKDTTEPSPNKNVLESDITDRVSVREKETIFEPTKVFQIVGSVSEPIKVSPVVEKANLIDSKFICYASHNENCALKIENLKGLDIAEGRVKQKESDKTAASSFVARMKSRRKLLKEAPVNEAGLSTTEVESKIKTTFEDERNKMPQVEVTIDKEAIKLSPTFEDEVNKMYPEVTLDVDEIQFITREIVKLEERGSSRSLDTISAEKVTCKKSLTDNSAKSSDCLNSIDPASENFSNNFSFANPTQNNKYPCSSTVSSTPEKPEPETSTVCTKFNYEVYEDPSLKDLASDNRIERFPRPLTLKHYAPFGRASRSKCDTPKSLSQSFSNHIDNVFSAYKSPSSISYQHISSNGDFYGDSVSNLESSGRLSHSWAVSSSDKKEHLYKILVIGELGTGKTSIIKRYVHQFFCQHYRATIGVDFALKVLNWDEDTIIRLQLWDIAGQERFGNMTRVYYKQAVGAFVVFDVSNPKTFDAVTKWKNDLDSKVTLPDGSNIPTILLANKCDQPKEGVVTNPSKMDEFCREKNFAGWFETSAKEDINIDDATKYLISKILNNEEEGLMLEEASDKDKFSIDEPTEVVESKKCIC